MLVNKYLSIEYSSPGVHGHIGRYSPNVLYIGVLVSRVRKTADVPTVPTLLTGLFTESGSAGPGALLALFAPAYTLYLRYL